jgi:hypothetical protein
MPFQVNLNIRYRNDAVSHWWHSGFSFRVYGTLITNNPFIYKIQKYYDFNNCYFSCKMILLYGQYTLVTDESRVSERVRPWVTDNARDEWKVLERTPMWKRSYFSLLQSMYTLIFKCIFSHNEKAEILLKLALNTNQSINVFFLHQGVVIQYLSLFLFRFKMNMRDLIKTWY